VYANVSDNLETLTLTCIRKDVRDGTIRNGQSRETDVDIHKKKNLEMGQSGMANLETLTLAYTRKRR
jgi:hypothetical protein